MVDFGSSWYKNTYKINQIRVKSKEKTQLNSSRPGNYLQEKKFALI